MHNYHLIGGGLANETHKALMCKPESYVLHYGMNNICQNNSL